jgi:predicted amino acid racemase
MMTPHRQMTALTGMKYPLLEIDTKRVFANATALRRLCLEKQVEPTAVIKGFNAIDCITAAIVEAGFKRLASSRLNHLKLVKEKRYAVQTVALRVPMLSELGCLVRYADFSLNSEYDTLRELNAEAGRQGKTHAVILMRDLGDLREGVWERERFYELAGQVEHEFRHLLLSGVGVNLTFYGSVIPAAANLSELVEDAHEIERLLGRSLDIVSGGSTSSLPLLVKGGLPGGINDLRIGEALLVPCELLGFWDCKLPELSNRALLLRAQIIECGVKPTMPRGSLGPDGFGNYRTYEDRGWRRRALLALGVYDIGDYEKLIPVDPGVKILGGSSDHLIVDIHDSRRAYKLGDLVDFELSYKSMLFATGNPLIEKVMVR